MTKRTKPIGYKSYRVRKRLERTIIDDLVVDKVVAENTNYLAGLFTHRYESTFYLQYRCPLCGDEVNVTRPLESNLPIDFEKHVAGEMIVQLRHVLSDHYKFECGSDRDRRIQTGEILFDKFNDGVYE